MSTTTPTPAITVAPVAPQVEATTHTEPATTPPWGTDAEFNPQKAWDLITNLRAQKNDPAVAKELDALRAEKAAREDAERTEAEKAQLRIQEAQDATAKTAAELAIYKAALKHGLSEEDTAALEGLPADRVEAVAERLATKAAPTPKAPSPAGQGNVGGPVSGGETQLTKAEVAQMYAEKRYEDIEKARVAGRLSGVLGPTP